MNTLKAIIESTEHNYSAYIEGIDGVVATGNSISEIKDNLVDAIQVFIETCKQLGCDVPVELTGDYSIEFKMDVKSLLSIYNGIFTKAGLERITGINQKQLWHYANGISKPRKAQARRIEDSLHRLGNELIAVTL